MTRFALYRRRASDCATMRDQARTERAWARLERERLDWLRLAEAAGCGLALRTAATGA